MIFLAFLVTRSKEMPIGLNQLFPESMSAFIKGTRFGGGNECLLGNDNLRSSSHRLS